MTNSGAAPQAPQERTAHGWDGYTVQMHNPSTRGDRLTASHGAVAPATEGTPVHELQSRERASYLDVPPPPAVRNTIERCLSIVPDLIDLWTPEVHKIDSYARGLVSEAEVRHDGLLAFEFIFRLIGGMPIPPYVATVPGKIGHKRALQGVPLEDVLDAVRLDFRVIWQAMLREAQPEDQPDLLQGAFRVWEAVERNIVEISKVYHQTELELARHRTDERHAWFNRLCDTAEPAPHVVSAAARVLDINADGTFLVVTSVSSDNGALRAAGERAAAAGLRVHLQPTAHGDLLLIQEARKAESFKARLPAQPLSFVDGIRGLALVPRAVHLAWAVAASIPADAVEPLSIDEAWPAVLLQDAPLATAMLRDRVIGNFAALKKLERAALTSTLRDFCRTGSVGETAAREFCHRNTILNRLAHTKMLTGLDARIPQQGAVLLLALEAARLAGEG